MVRSNDSLVPARLKDEVVDGFRRLQLCSGHHKISWRPELTRHILFLKTRVVIKDLLGSLLPNDTHKLGRIRIERDDHYPLEIAGPDSDCIQAPAVGDANLFHPLHQVFGDIADQIMIAE